MPIEVRTDYGRLHDLIRGPNGDVVTWLRKTARRVENTAKTFAPVDTGRLRGSIGTEIDISGQLLIARVAARTNYAIYPERGTGIYGPSRRPIKARRARVLHWVDSEGEHFVPMVRGQKPQHYMARALRVAVDWPIKDLT